MRIKETSSRTIDFWVYRVGSIFFFLLGIGNVYNSISTFNWDGNLRGLFFLLGLGILFSLLSISLFAYSFFFQKCEKPSRLIKTVLIFAPVLLAVPIFIASTKLIFSHETVDHYLQELKNDDSKKQIIAIRKLARIKDTTSIAPLLELIEDDNANVNVQIHALSTIGAIGDPSVINRLASHLDEPKLAEKIIEVFGEIGHEDAIYPLLNILQNRYPYGLTDSNESGVFYQTIISIGQIGSTYSLAELVRLLTIHKSDEYQNITVRGLIYEALGGIECHLSFAVLVKGLRDWPLRYDAAHSLEKLNWKSTYPDPLDLYYFEIAMKNNKKIKEEWSEVKRLLLKDIGSLDKNTIKVALYSFILIGNDDVLPDLIYMLNNSGNKAMAEVYLNCGQEQLKNAAERWARRKGYEIFSTGGVPPVRWGGL